MSQFAQWFINPPRSKDNQLKRPLSWAPAIAPGLIKTKSSRLLPANSQLALAQFLGESSSPTPTPDDTTARYIISGYIAPSTTSHVFLYAGGVLTDLMDGEADPYFYAGVGVEPQVGDILYLSCRSSTTTLHSIFKFNLATDTYNIISTLAGSGNKTTLLGLTTDTHAYISYSTSIGAGNIVAIDLSDDTVTVVSVTVGFPNFMVSDATSVFANVSGTLYVITGTSVVNTGISLSAEVNVTSFKDEIYYLTNTNDLYRYVAGGSDILVLSGAGSSILHSGDELFIKNSNDLVHYDGTTSSTATAVGNPTRVVRHNSMTYVYVSPNIYRLDLTTNLFTLVVNSTQVISPINSTTLISEFNSIFYIDTAVDPDTAVTIDTNVQSSSYPTNGGMLYVKNADTTIYGTPATGPGEDTGQDYTSSFGRTLGLITGGTLYPLTVLDGNCIGHTGAGKSLISYSPAAVAQDNITFTGQLFCLVTEADLWKKK